MNRNQEFPRTSLPTVLLSALATGVVALVVASIAIIVAVSSRIDASELASASASHVCLTPGSDARAPSAQATRARQAEALHAQSLQRLSVDPRWDDPEQHDALTRAMQDSVRLMVQHRAEANRLEGSPEEEVPR